MAPPNDVVVAAADAGEWVQLAVGNVAAKEGACCVKEGVDCAAPLEVIAPEAVAARGWLVLRERGRLEGEMVLGDGDRPLDLERVLRSLVPFEAEVGLNPSPEAVPADAAEEEDDTP